MNWIKKRIWQWPNGLVWKVTEKTILTSRRKKYDLFISLMRPKLGDRILDVGVAPYWARGTNFLEQWYPYPENITANDDPEGFKDFNRYFPKVNLFLLTLKVCHFQIIIW